ncbi:MAG: insulinase family protein [Clostridiales bacterium]|nr:insulinase family protein [Clostridiales bacterium]
MQFYKKYDNGLRVVVNKMDSIKSVSVGVLVKTGSVNESEEINGISHYIEHMLFKGTTTKNAFEISDTIDSIGAQINAFTSKEITCYYTKSTSEHFKKSFEVLSDIFFNSTFLEEESEKEKGVIIEEINMYEDMPEDLCMDLLSEAFFGKRGLGQTIIGKEQTVRSFNKDKAFSYMDEYYTPENVVISISGNIDEKLAFEIVEENFLKFFTRKNKSRSSIIEKPTFNGNIVKVKDIEQSHIALAFPTYNLADDRSDVFNIANTVLGGGMSSRLFQTVREKLGLAYSVYSYPSLYETNGVLDIYAGVNPKSRDLAFEEIVKEVKKIKKGITEKEFLRGKEQIKSSFIMGQENSATQMLLYGKYMLFFDKLFSFDEKIERINKTTLKDVNDILEDSFDFSKMATATVGRDDRKLN